MWVASLILFVPSVFLLTGSVEELLQHETMADMARSESAGRSCAKLIRPALLMALGLELGLLLMPLTTAIPAPSVLQLWWCHQILFPKFEPCWRSRERQHLEKS